MDNKELLSGSLIKGFQKVKSLQNGYSGKVFYGFQKNTGKGVVVKCYYKERHWKTETKALSLLKHPNIIQLVGKPFVNTDNVLDEDSQESIYILALEYAHKGDLYEKLIKGVFFSEEETREICIPLVTALKYAYEKHGISHRDIKLENILEMKDGTIKIADWGLCAFDIKKRQCSSSYGTLGYMAPEMIRREKYNSQKTDIWALGVVLFSLCTGSRPYGEPCSRQKNKGDESWKDEWLSAIINNNMDLWWKSHLQSTKNTKNLSPEFVDLIKKMFHPVPEKRISLIEMLEHNWVKLYLKKEKKSIILPSISKKVSNNKMINIGKFESCKKKCKSIFWCCS
jgi:serine/threonine protein kinase